MQVSEAVRAYYLWMKGNGHSMGTARIYRAVLETLPDVDLEKVTPALLQMHAGRWDGLAPATRNLKKAAIRSLFCWLCEAGHLDKNPSRLLKSEKLPQQEAAYLGPEEVSRFREAIKANPRDRLLFEAYLMTGCRLRELLALNSGDVRGKDVIMITGKGRKSRKVYLNPMLTALIADSVNGTAPDEPLFRSALGNRLSASRVRELLRRYCAMAGIKQISPHGLRHTFLTSLYSKTKDLRLCQEAAGHSSPQTTTRYCHVSQAQLQTAVCGLYQ